MENYRCKYSCLTAFCATILRLRSQLTSISCHSKILFIHHVGTSQQILMRWFFNLMRGGSEVLCIVYGKFAINCHMFCIDESRIVSIGIMLAERKEGPFRYIIIYHMCCKCNSCRMEIQWMRAVQLARRYLLNVGGLKIIRQLMKRYDPLLELEANEYSFFDK